MNKILEKCKYFGYLSPSFRVVDIMQFIFLGVISTNNYNIHSFLKFLIISATLAIVFSIIIYKVDGKDIEENNQRCRDNILFDNEFKEALELPKPLNSAFVLLALIDLISVVAAGYNIIHEMQKTPTGNNWLSLNKNKILLAIAALLLLTLLSKIMCTASLQTRDNYIYYEQISMNRILSKMLDKKYDDKIKIDPKLEAFYSSRKHFQIMKDYKKIPIKGHDKKFLSYKLALLKKNNKKLVNYKKFIFYSVDECINILGDKIALEQSKLDNINKINTGPLENHEQQSDNVSAYKGYIITGITALIIAIYSTWMPIILPGLPGYCYAAFGILLGILLIDNLNKNITSNLKRLEQEQKEYISEQKKLKSALNLKTDQEKTNAQINFIINISKPRIQKPGSRFLPVVVVPIFNFLAIAFPIGYVLHMVTKITHLPTFYQSISSGIIFSLITCSLSAIYAYLKTKGSTQDKRNKIVFEAMEPLLSGNLNGDYNAVRYKPHGGNTGRKQTRGLN